MLILEHVGLYVKFGDPSFIGFWDIVWKKANKQTNKQTHKRSWKPSPGDCRRRGNNTFKVLVQTVLLHEADIYTVGHKKTHQNVFRHNFRKSRRILNKFGRLLLK